MSATTPAIASAPARPGLRGFYTQGVLIALVLGVLTGWATHRFLSARGADSVAEVLSVVAEIFLRLIKMVIGPLILVTLVGGIAHLRDGKAVARIGMKALLWFLAASLVSLGVGAFMALTLHPGTGLHLSPPVTAVTTGIKGTLSARDIILHAFPTSIFEALSSNEMLQVVVFALFAGIALGSLGERGTAILALVDQLASLMLVITNYVMLLAPIGVFAALAVVIARNGLDMLASFGGLLASFYASLAVLCAVLLLVGQLILGKRLWSLLALLRQPAVVAFSTSSSEAAYPRVSTALESFGASRKVAGFVLPLGYSFNLDASMMYCTFGALFIAQAYDIQLQTRDIVTLLLMLMLMTKGIAAVPRGALITIAAVSPYFHLPEAGLLLLLGVDHFMNMGRSVANVLGNGLAVAAVAKWEGELEERQPS